MLTRELLTEKQKKFLEIPHAVNTTAGSYLPDSDPSIYLISVGEGMPTKIGWSFFPLDRFKGIQNKTQYPLTLHYIITSPLVHLNTILFTDILEFPVLELAIQRYFSPFQFYNEWFDLSAEQIVKELHSIDRIASLSASEYVVRHPDGHDLWQETYDMIAQSFESLNFEHIQYKGKPKKVVNNPDGTVTEPLNAYFKTHDLQSSLSAVECSTFVPWKDDEYGIGCGLFGSGDYGSMM